MSLVKRINNLDFPSIPGIFSDFLSRDLFNWEANNFSSTRTTIPSVNVRETADNFEVELAAPGMKKEDFEITLNGNTLTIASSKQHQDEHKEGDYTRREFSYQSFQRSFELPKDVVDDDKIQASYQNGLLLLTVPKKEEAKKKGPRTIAIS